MRKYELIDSLREDLKRFKYKPDIKIVAYYTLPYWEEEGNPFMEFYDYYISEVPDKSLYNIECVEDGFTLDDEIVELQEIAEIKNKEKKITYTLKQH